MCDEHRDLATASLVEVWIDETEGRSWFLSEVKRELEGKTALVTAASLTLSEYSAQKNQLGLACEEFLARPKFFRAKDLKLSTTAARTRLVTAIPISDIGILSRMWQATTGAILCLTADAGKMVIPMRASTSEMSVESSAAVWEIWGTILASRSIPRIRS